jgi:hypothetical protein
MEFPVVRLSLFYKYFAPTEQVLLQITIIRSGTILKRFCMPDGASIVANHDYSQTNQIFGTETVKYWKIQSGFFENLKLFAIKLQIP